MISRNLFQRIGRKLGIGLCFSRLIQILPCLNKELSSRGSFFKVVIPTRSSPKHYKPFVGV